MDISGLSRRFVGFVIQTVRSSVTVEETVPIPSRPIPDLARDITMSQVEQCFAGAHFPADRKQLVSYARDHFASADLLAVLDSIPDQVYHGPSEIGQAIRKLV